MGEEPRIARRRADAAQDESPLPEGEGSLALNLALLPQEAEGSSAPGVIRSWQRFGAAELIRPHPGRCGRG